MPEIRTMDAVEDLDIVDDAAEEGEARIYEIGFHIAPSLSEEDIRKEFESVKKIIKDIDGSSFISEGLPSLKTLSYPLSKKVKAVKSTYSKAYFGWIKFTAEPEQMADLKKKMDELDNVIRYLIISTVRENTMVAKSEMMNESEEGSDEPTEAKSGSGPHEIPEDIDKTIDELVVQ